MNSDFQEKIRKFVFKIEFELGYIVQGYEVRFDGKQKFLVNSIFRTEIFEWIVKFLKIDLKGRKCLKIVWDYRETETDQKEDHLNQF